MDHNLTDCATKTLLKLKNISDELLMTYLWNSRSII